MTNLEIELSLVALKYIIAYHNQIGETLGFNELAGAIDKLDSQLPGDGIDTELVKSAFKKEQRRKT